MQHQIGVLYSTITLGCSNFSVIRFAAAIAATGDAMAGRYLTPYSGRIFAVCTATWLLVLSLVGPAFASSNLPPSGDSRDTTPPNVHADQLHASIIDHEFGAKEPMDEQAADADVPLVPADDLTPEAEAALRKLLQNGIERGSQPTSDVETTAEEDDGPATIKARVPGVSDGALQRYKRNMYRRDI